ncbi:MAG: hypothetical protein WC749_02270 [Dehalococcoidia bacterium]
MPKIRVFGFCVREYHDIPMHLKPLWTPIFERVWYPLFVVFDLMFTVLSKTFPNKFVDEGEL